MHPRHFRKGLSSCVHNNKLAYIWIIATCTVPIIAILIMNFVKTHMSSYETFQNQNQARPETYDELVHLITNISFAMTCGDASDHDDGYNTGTELPCDINIDFTLPYSLTGSPRDVEFLEASKITYQEEYDIKMRDRSAEQVAYNTRHLIIKVVSVCVMLTTFLLISCLYYYVCKKKRLNDGEENHNEQQGLTGTTFELCSPRPFTFEDLSRATNNFHQDQILGKGGFGAVYKADFPNSQTLAVKRVSSTSQQGIKEYKAEVTIVSRSHHKHLVQLIGWCHDIKGEFLLVYELMDNKSLDVHLFDPEMDSLAWSVRYKIAQGLAKALRYLHEECGKRSVLHLDIKSSNVLLDSKFEPKLGDFGLSRLVDHDKSMELSVMAGTRGYLAPECVLTGKVSTHSDVYSFGVVALELVTGRKTIDPTAEEDQKVLVKWVQNLYKAGKAMEAVDPKLGDDYKELQVKGLIVVGLWCVLQDFRARPSMREIVRILNNTQDPLLDLHIPTLVPDPVPFDFDSIREPSFGSLDLLVPMEMENPIPVDPMVLSSGHTDRSEDEDQTYSPLFMWRHVSFLKLWRFFIGITWFRSSQNG